MMNLKQFTKILNLTFSENDSEALSAMRKANSILKMNRMMWEDLISPKKKRNQDREIFEKKYDLKKVDLLLEQIFKDPQLYSSSEIKFLHSIHSFLKTYHYLTERQIESLTKIVAPKQTA